MSTGFNTDIQSILNKAVGQLESLGGSTGSLGTSSGNNFVNSIWGLTQEGQAAVNGNDNQKAQAITNIVQNLLGMLMSLGTKETSKANKEVKQNEKQANTLEKNADKAAQTTEEKVQEIISNIADNTTSISKAMDEINALGGDKGDIAKALETLEEQLKIIDDNKKILNDGVSSPEAKQKALENLIGASQVINELVASIAEVQKEIETQNGIVENTANNVAGLVEESVNVITNGAQTLQGFIQQGGIQTATTTTIAAQGTADVSVGSIATAKGSALSSNLVTATAGQKLLRIGSDRTSAGQTRIKGATENLSALTKAIGQMGSNLGELSEFTNSIGNLGNSFVALVGQYGSQLEPVITAVGSWTSVADANAQLEEAITEYQSNSGLEVEMPWNQNSNIKTENDNKESNTWVNYTGAKQVTSDNQNQTSFNGKFEFDTNLFREAFKK